MESLDEMQRRINIEWELFGHKPNIKWGGRGERDDSIQILYNKWFVGCLYREAMNGNLVWLPVATFSADDCHLKNTKHEGKFRKVFN
jgi:hypothetical protein